MVIAEKGGRRDSLSSVIVVCKMPPISEARLATQVAKVDPIVERGSPIRVVPCRVTDREAL